MMEHLEVSHLFAMLVVMLGAAKVGGALAQRIGQPAVLGELVGGVIVGQSGLRLVNTSYETIHMLSELGVFILLLAIGLETDLRMLVARGSDVGGRRACRGGSAVWAGLCRLSAAGVDRSCGHHGGGNLDGDQRGDHSAGPGRPRTTTGSWRGRSSWEPPFSMTYLVWSFSRS